MKPYYHWEAEYFEAVIFPKVVQYKLEYPWNQPNKEFTVEEFCLHFNKIPRDQRTYKISSRHNWTIELMPKYSRDYNLVCKMLHCMVGKNKLSVRYVSVGTRTEPIFKIN